MLLAVVEFWVTFELDKAAMMYLTAYESFSVRFIFVMK